jgi:DNA (cytosine-5)-methyltransferase 1
MRVLDLFSGIGGFSLGLERAGPFRTVAFCEREPFPQAVLRKHWPDTPIYDDVRTIPTNELGRIGLICGGFPCQPWSVAGEQRGAEDDRDLWPVMASLIEELRPRWVVGENVRGFVNEPLGLQRSLSDLESIGYEVAPFVIPACAVDAPHRRDRVWIVAHANDTGPQRNLRTGAGTKEKVSEGREQFQPRSGTMCGREDVADTYGTHVEGQRVTKRIQTKRSATSSASRWLPEPSVGRVANGVPRRVDRLKALGNAVVPQVVEQIGRAIMEVRDAS